MQTENNINNHLQHFFHIERQEEKCLLLEQKIAQKTVHKKKIKTWHKTTISIAASLLLFFGISFWKNNKNLHTPPSVAQDILYEDENLIIYTKSDELNKKN